MNNFLLLFLFIFIFLLASNVILVVCNLMGQISKINDPSACIFIFDMGCSTSFGHKKCPFLRTQYPLGQRCCLGNISQNQAIIDMILLCKSSYPWRCCILHPSSFYYFYFGMYQLKKKVAFPIAQDLQVESLHFI